MRVLANRVREIVDSLLRRSPRQVAPVYDEGARAEELAAQFLTSVGGRVLARNVRCRGGEIDLIVLISGTLVFVEVRKRRRKDYGGAAGSISERKQMRIVLASRYWLAGAGREHAWRPCRYDAILLDQLSLNAVKWIQDAFRPA